MAKKKKKLTRLNQAIRHFFDNEGFDEGIEKVDTETLIELSHALGIVPDTWDKESLIRIYRRLWSDADVDIRQMIVDFFKVHDKIYRSSKVKEPAIERTEKIASILDEMNVSNEEAQLLRDSFIDVRSKKINLQKMEAKLIHLRYDTKRKDLEKALEGKFDFEDRFIFNRAFTYTLFGESFKKILPVTSSPFSNTHLFETDAAKLITEITAVKTELTAQKQQEVDDFLQGLNNKHPYLTPEQMISSLKSAPPESNITAPPLSNRVLTGIIGKEIPLRGIEQVGDEVIITMDAQCPVPFLDKTLHYTLHATLKKAELLTAVWEGRALELTSNLERQKAQNETAFNDELGALIQECGKNAKLLGIEEQELYAMVYDPLLPLLHDSLVITPKIARKVIYHFNQSIQQALLKRQRQQLLARTIRDFKNLFPIAREMRRRLVFHTGPTNSGKTYEAMQVLKRADTGYYLAPLRLLALEGYEQLKSEGVDVSLITGEEQLLSEDATHISSTIEMLNFDVDVDVCVIDEVQMIGDRDRGWAWANAIIGAPAKTVIMTGSPNAIAAISALAEYLGEPLEIIEFQRKNPLELMRHATPVANIKPGTAVVAFSRKEVLRLKQQLVRYYKVSVVYGNLSPEVRREEARRFREGETEILVATDAIAMGLNLPIQTILFARGDKFDGETQRPLTPSEIHQIAGRAGRFGLSEKGYIGALRPDVLQVIHEQFPKPAKAVPIPFNVSANLEHIKLVGSILEEESLSEILNFFVKNMTFDGPFRATNLEGMAESAAIVDRFRLDLTSKYHLACAPITLVSPYIVSSFERYIHALEQHKPVAYIPPSHLGEYASTMEQLLEAEDRVKEISLYLWLSYRFGDYFVDAPKAREYRVILNRFIEESLRQSHFVPRCRQCTKPLPMDSAYPICQSCFRQLNQQKRQTDRAEETRPKRRPRH